MKQILSPFCLWLVHSYKEWEEKTQNTDMPIKNKISQPPPAFAFSALLFLFPFPIMLITT